MRTNSFTRGHIIIHAISHHHTQFVLKMRTNSFTRGHIRTRISTQIRTHVSTHINI